ncbi:MAG: hypothetical protein J1E34_07895 [Oscillospiraceae bacterium]|nr:hypothetical protein [Oscillospiraceae bacterium]
MFSKLKEKRKKKKKKQRPEQFQSLTANGAAVEAINFAICPNPDGTARLEIRTKDICEALHFEHIDFELKTNLKMIKVSGTFKEAVNEKQVKLYIFDVDSFEQFYI